MHQEYRKISYHVLFEIFLLSDENLLLETGICTEMTSIRLPQTSQLSIIDGAPPKVDKFKRECLHTLGF